MKYILSNSQFFHQKFGGVTRYSINLFNSLLNKKQNIDIIAPLYKNRFLKEINKKNVNGIYLAKYPNIKLLRILNNFFLEKKLNNVDIETIHDCYYPESLIKTKAKKILTIHDLIHEKRASEYRNVDFEFRKKVFENTDEFICVSQKTKNDLIQFYKLNEKKIHVIYHGSDHVHEIPNIELNFNFLKDPYLLYVGSRKKYKNFNLLLNVFLNSKIIYKDFKIVCFGNEKINNKKEKELYDKKKLILIKGDDSILKKLLIHSAGLISTSNDEGFGLPILESMTLGCNVFAPNIEVFKEIYKDKVFFYEKDETESLKENLEKHLYSQELLNEKKISAREYAANFSWDKTASQTLETYC